MAVGIETVVKVGLVQTQRGRERLQRWIAKSAQILTQLVQEQRVVVLPELALIISTLGRFGRPDRFRT